MRAPSWSWLFAPLLMLSACEGGTLGTVSGDEIEDGLADPGTRVGDPADPGASGDGAQVPVNAGGRDTDAPEPVPPEPDDADDVDSDHPVDDTGLADPGDSDVPVPDSDLPVDTDLPHDTDEIACTDETVDTFQVGTGGCCDEDCGPPLRMAMWECADGSWGGNIGECAPGDDGQCAWVIRACPTPAPGDTCVVDETCESGELCVGGLCAGVSCPPVSDPVCGVDGETYRNACLAEIAHVQVASEGACDEPKGCYGDDDCGEDAFCTAAAECLSDPSCPASDVCYGRCIDLPCPLNIQPVCGHDGKTYESDCEAMRLGIYVVHQGACEPAPPPACTLEYAPVCGEDGNTYGNACQAGVAGVAVAYKGACISR